VISLGHNDLPRGVGFSSLARPHQILPGASFGSDHLGAGSILFGGRFGFESHLVHAEVAQTVDAPSFGTHARERRRTMKSKSKPSNTKVIDGVTHVWDIFENAWVPLSYWKWVNGR
jgi:hypothetical protein